MRIARTRRYLQSHLPGHHEVMDGEFRLVQQSPVPHYATVRVTWEALTNPSAAVSPNAFAWLLEAYGPNARTGPAHSEWMAEATSGAMYALREAGVAGHVTITHIHYANADTMPGDVKFAAAFAVWSALGDVPSAPPVLAGSKVIFPEV